MYTPLDFYLALEMLIAQFGNPFPSSLLGPFKVFTRFNLSL